MKITSATLSVLLERGLPVVTEYELYKIIHSLKASGEYKGEKFRGRRGPIDRGNYRRIVGALLSSRYLRPDPDFSGIDTSHDLFSREEVNFTRVFRISDIPDGSAEDIACIVDPFCYLSHLSAMQRYSLTNRIPEALSLSSPLRWTEVRDAKLAKDYPNFAELTYVAPLLRINFPDVIRRRTVVLHKTVRTPKVRPVRGTALRIASVGEIFVQMLDRPELCGGMPHVYDVWMEHARTYANEIIQAVDEATESIIKVRAGYLLDAGLGLQDPRVEAWERFAQRGGSRKLDPSAPYVPIFSEKWKISLNVERGNSPL
ncbi:conserved hypothetical protein [uncultured Pleomorphomonas sp.]|uniref:AbiEi antitoxin C-terminal domain-containing protein n=1 Tax=uncultured Pleomorphomonas sp. TaxID=442121 RepID=A0A212LPS0_9HYPH|nr:hypothetical protein [uncultured Pleomorphomonas sp.]SCM79471.1 conserved hypothetical protein [uncultured Pleomorphomonas sp.]